ncbi:MAG TPA: O-antigen ligase family protein [Actinomycetota bacterium]|nr:O-antigen ligase family protein [Actinomycetota bacterium]
MAGIPLFCLPGVISDPFSTAKLALLVTLVLSVAGLRIAESLMGRPREGLRVMIVPVAAAVVPVTVAWLATPYKAWGAYGEYQRYEGVIPAILLGIFVMLLADAFGRQIRPVVATLLASAGFVAAYAILQATGLDPLSWPRQRDFAFSTIGNSNSVGAFLAIAAALCPGAIADADERRTRSIAWGATVVIWGGLVAAHSEGAIAAAAGGTLLSAGLLAGRKWGGVRSAALVGVLVVAIALPVAVLVSHFDLAPADAIGDQGVVRRDFWQASAGLAASHLVTGAGPDAFALEGVRHRPLANALRYGYGFPSAPHSVPLSSLANTGFLGVAGFVLLACWAARATLRVARRRAAAEPLALASAGAVCAYLIQSLVNIDDISVRVALWTVVACLAGFASKHSPSGSAETESAPVKESLGTVVAMYLVVLGAACGAWWGGRIVMADRHLLVGTEMFTTGNVDGAFREFDAAIALRDVPAYRVYYGERLGAIARFLRDEGGPFVERMREQFAYLEDAPDLSGILTFADALYRWGPHDASAYEEAWIQYERALGIDAKNPLIAAAASDVLVEMGRAGEAVAMLEGYDAVPTGFPQFWGAVAKAYAADGRTEEAQLYVERALDNDPEDERALAAKDLLDRS